MKKHFYLIGSLCSMTTGLLNAQPTNNQPQQPVTATTQPRGMITPSVSPQVRNGIGLTFTGDFIWWKTNISGMEYATSGVLDGSFVPVGTSTKRGHVSQPNFDFEPGFKIGAAWDFGYDGWDLYANYTWLNGDTEHNSVTAHKGNGAITLFPSIDIFGDSTPLHITKESSKWRQYFNVLDVELGRNFFISRHLTLRPHFGLKNAWISEKFDLMLTQADANFADHLKRKQTLWGIGTRAGLNTVWHFSKNWGVYGDIAFTALWSDFHVKTKDRAKNQTFKIASTTLNTKEVITEVMPVIETGLGLTYMTWLGQEEYLLQFSAGWEEQVWLGFNNFVDANRSGNLSVHGLTLKAGLAF